MSFFAVSSLVCAAFCLALSFFTLLSGRSKSHILLALFNLNLVPWAAFAFLAAETTESSTALQMWKLVYTAGFLVAPLFYHLVITLCRLKGRKPLILLNYVQGAFFSIGGLLSSRVLAETFQVSGMLYAKATPFFAVAVFFHIIFVSLSYVELFRSLEKTSGHEKKLLQFVFYGFSVGFLGGATVWLPSFGVPLFYPGNLGILLYACITTYAILRMRILDLEEIAQAAHRDKLALLSTVVAGINHEIRNPFYIIQGTAQNFLDSCKDGGPAYDKARKMAETMNEQTVRALGIMKNFSMLIKRQSNQNLKLEPVAVADAVSSALIFVQHEMNENQILFRQEIPADHKFTQVSRQEIEEIFLNLILNAGQALKNQKDAPEIRIQSRLSGKSLRVEISDNGPGIEPSELKHIFSPFYTTKNEGTGLGLYITKLLVEKNNGRIRIEPAPGRTVFTLEFPLG